MTPKQKAVLEALIQFEKANGRYPRQCDLIRFIKYNDLDIKTDRRNIAQFIEQLEDKGLIEKIPHKIVTKKVKTEIRIKVLKQKDEETKNN